MIQFRIFPLVKSRTVRSRLMTVSAALSIALVLSPAISSSAFAAGADVPGAGTAPISTTPIIVAPVKSPAVQSAAPSTLPSTTVLPAMLENSVVKIFSTLRGPDPFKPWSKAAPQEVTGSGVVIEGKRILTNAHVVGYASQVQIQANQSGDKVSATVVAIARGIDLAILKLDDESFFDTHAPAARASVLPDVRDAVLAYGYPIGGSSLSITKGIVSRIEFVNYGYSTAGLRIQIDAAINPGNSGGPVMAGDKMVGLAFSGINGAQNIGYIIPNEEIDLFLADIGDGVYDGKPAMHDDIQTLENPAMRIFLKLDKTVEGAIVHRPAQSDASYPLKEFDVITHIGDSPIDNQAMVKLGPNLRVQFQYRVQQLAKNGKVPLTVMRSGKQMKIQLPVVASRPLLIPDLNGGYPSYFIYGPIAFSRATAEFLTFISSNANGLNAFAFNASPLVTRRGDEPDAAREELVVVTAPFFPHKLTSGYSNRFGAVVYSINNVPVRSLRHLVTLLRDLKDEFVTIHFDQRAGETMVLPRKAMMESTESILTDSGIRAQASPDMLAVWQGKK
ncbi:trypsin-like peptidase domain-containing protein [Undibacterium sp. RTI2.1]|uniref:S1C family serine protease n=1 Tax=unclassified Undibacterium TaxID=2630295 RepID=UPI002AB5C5A5|nr:MULTISPECIES: trypsin-like peptidase domain-containing protein [unclassified Undibacterium]MDY7540341.1 trypsin-like peptidase domain-containing protein [Undibacterium sp. 5I1]MEB0029949.1 trypsin-like peptidase domain-containing protein [Undibacterium sp. RTI2.1]MEB0117087.1 trypsin-like peptidase domain-containing protein [Undibacterium sp. RTI2.2]MEB0229973.1 trypsin-like peptidase domain-containing protein [Undibacterium sp. 10I3]MEB0259510.1 trypsin-like peptidase domain-containing pro